MNPPERQTPAAELRTPDMSSLLLHRVGFIHHNCPGLDIGSVGFGDVRIHATCPEHVVRVIRMWPKVMLVVRIVGKNVGRPSPSTRHFLGRTSNQPKLASVWFASRASSCS
jgi:hypothetical protein